MEQEPKRKKVGLALSGGFIRSTASIGVIEVLRGHGIPIDMIAGCSAGAGIAAAYANDRLEEAKHRLINGPRKEYLRIIFEPTVPKQGFLRGQRTREFFKEFVGEKDFSELGVPLYITATDLNTLKPVVLDEGKVAEAIQASVGVAGVWVPVRRGTMILADGGNFHQIPSQPLYDHGADYVIAIDASQPPNILIRTMAFLKKNFFNHQNIEQRTFTKDPHIIDLVRRAVHLSTMRIESFYASSYRYDILIKPYVKTIKRWNVSKVAHLVEEGRKAAEKAVPKIKQDLGLL